MTEAEMDELYYLLILAKMKENDRVADVLAEVINKKPHKVAHY